MKTRSILLIGLLTFIFVGTGCSNEQIPIPFLAKPTEAIAPTQSVKPTDVVKTVTPTSATIKPTDTPVPTNTATPVPTNTATPTNAPVPTSAATSTPTVAPTATPIVETVPATCTSEGKTTWYYQDGTIKEEIIPMLPHVLSEPVRVEPTVDKAGSITITCKVCGQIISIEEIAKLTPTPTHTPKPTKTPTPTPTSTPTPTNTPKPTATPTPGVHEHNWVVFEILEPSCHFAGQIDYVCSICGEHWVEPLEPLYEYVEVRTEPTTTSEGKIDYYCSHCGAYVYSEVIPKLEANATPTPTPKATNTPKPTNTPRPTRTPTPTPTPSYTVLDDGTIVVTDFFCDWNTFLPKCPFKTLKEARDYGLLHMSTPEEGLKTAEYVGAVPMYDGFLPTYFPPEYDIHYEYNEYSRQFNDVYNMIWFNAYLQIDSNTGDMFGMGWYYDPSDTEFARPLFWTWDYMFTRF